jgi:hypothetical protein
MNEKLEFIEQLMKLMQRHSIDKVEVDGITIYRSQHDQPKHTTVDDDLLYYSSR